MARVYFGQRNYSFFPDHQPLRLSSLDFAHQELNLSTQLHVNATAYISSKPRNACSSRRQLTHLAEG